MDTNSTKVNGAGTNGVPKPSHMKASTVVEPGVYYDNSLRVFRLQCRSSTYAFRIDDDKNLEHLYWGTSLPLADDLMYLTNSHVAGPFDPVGTVPPTSAVKLLGLDELAGDMHMSDKWKMFTKQKDSEGDDARGRRLENASWRLWNMQRYNGGDLNVDVSKEKLEKSLRIEGTKADGTVTPPGTQTAAPKSPEFVSGRRHATGWDAKLSEKGMLSAKSVQDFSRMTGLTPTSPVSQPLSTPTSSVGDFAEMSQGQWQQLDRSIVGKNTKLLEFSDCGTGDYREPSFKVRFHNDGSSICPLQYKSHKIVSRKLKIADSPLPSVYTDDNTEATTLVIDMWDNISKVRVQLYYTVMHDYDIIIRRSAIFNEGNGPVTLEHLSSGTIDFDAEHEFYVTQLSGAWARERQYVTRKLEDGVTNIKSVRGTSSHQFNPFVVVTPENSPRENDGACFGFCLVYSGNFAITAELSEYKRLRVNAGINQEMFSWRLDNKGRENNFYSPELIMSFSNTGLGALSRDMHRLIRERLIPKQWRYQVPPVLLNTWEAVYFDFTHETIVEIARCAGLAGIELLVLDDGWFGRRNDASTSLGDWKPNLEKLPFGLNGLARAVNECGVKFGIWVEPEMVSVDSDLFREHPDWCLCVPRRRRTTGRNQLVLDFSRQDVVDHVYEQIEDLLNSANIEYVKWDMNRHLTEIFSEKIHRERQGEISHRFILGVYSVFRKLITKFPNIRIESCSGGGGRFDAGMLAFTSQIWTSDNTDALSRMKIQYGTSMAYPLSCMGAHVSAVPNHQTGRSATMKTRSLLAMCGTFGYELDPRVWNADDIAEIKGYIAMFKRVSELIYEGDLYRLWSPFHSSSMAWMVVSRDQMRAIVFAFKVRREVGVLEPRLKLHGLRPELVYCVEELCPGTVTVNPANGAIVHDPRGVYQLGSRIDVSGTTLAYAGLPVKFLFDGDSVCYELNAIDKNGTKINGDRNPTTCNNDS